MAAKSRIEKYKSEIIELINFYKYYYVQKYINSSIAKFFNLK